MTPDGTMGRPRKLTERAIVEAVLAKGFAGLTVPAVAERLGVSTITVYRYAPTRAELLSLAWNHVITTTRWPPITGTWREVLRDQGIAFWNVLAEHPGVVTELARLLVPVEMMHHIDGITEALIDRGFVPADALLAVDFVIDLTVDHRRGVENIRGAIDESIVDELAESWAPNESDSPHRAAARAAMRDAILVDPFDWYRQKLELALDGIEHRFSR